MQHHTEQHNLTTQHNTAQHDTTLRHIKHYCTPHCSPHHTHASPHQAVRLGVPPHTHKKHSAPDPSPLHTTTHHTAGIEKARSNVHYRSPPCSYKGHISELEWPCPVQKTFAEGFVCYDYDILLVVVFNCSVSIANLFLHCVHIRSPCV